MVASLVFWMGLPVSMGLGQVPRPTPPPAAVGPGTESGANASSAAEADFLQWKAEQARLATEKESVEVERLSPLIAQAAQGSSLPGIQALIEQIENSRSLGDEAKARLASPLYDRLAALLSGAASAAIANNDLVGARSYVMEARHSLDHVASAAQSGPALTQVQAYYVEAVCKAAMQEAQHDLEAANAQLSLARGMLDMLAMPQGPAAEAARAQVAHTERELAAFQVTQTIEQAQQAEKQRNLRLALYLYEDAQRRGGQTEEAIDRIEEEKRSPFLEGTASFLVPGLGQVIGGRPLPGLLFFAGTAGLITAGSLLTASASDKYDRYLDASSNNSADQRYGAVQARWIGAEVAFAAALLLHLWDTYDAYSDAQQFNRDHF